VLDLYFRDPDEIEVAAEASTVGVVTSNWWSPWIDVAKSKVFLFTFYV